MKSRTIGLLLLALGSMNLFASATAATEEAKLTASDGAAFDGFAEGAVAIDGDTLVVGVYQDDVGANTNQGSAYVFTRTGSSWTEQAKLTASDGASNDRFGIRVAVDGDTVLVGAFSDDAGINIDQGSAYVFTRTGSTWTEAAKLTASDGGPNDAFGVGVAMDGDTLVVGARGDDLAKGAAYVFTRTGSSWTEQAKLTASDGANNDIFGHAVDVDGDTAAVGAPWDDTGANIDQGSAYVFTRSGSSWSHQAKLSASDGSIGDNFGIRVAVDGDTVVSGAWLDDVGANPDQGSAYVFTRAAETWTEEAQLTAADGAASDRFGISVHLDGGTIAAGSYLDDVGLNVDQGSAYLFTRNGGTWSLKEKLTASDGAASDIFGHEVHVDGATVGVGAPFDDIGVNLNQGSAYVFALAPESMEECAKGGWQTFTNPSFKNQGDCVSYVTTEGENAPAG